MSKITITIDDKALRDCIETKIAVLKRKLNKEFNPLIRDILNKEIADLMSGLGSIVLGK